MFDPYFRFSASAIQKQAKHVLNNQYFSLLLEEIPNVILIINKARQVVYANRTFIEQLNFKSNDDFFGKRPGECLDCVRAIESEAGCGSTDYCKVCGFANVLGQSELGRQSLGECSIITRGGKTHSFSVFTRPFVFENQNYIFCYLQDISDKRSQQFLEKTFLHDIQNSVSVLYAMHDILEDMSAEEIRTTIESLSRKLNEEINSYRLITSAEDNSLMVKSTIVNILELIESVKADLLHIKAFRHKEVHIRGSATPLYTDKTLLRRIMINLLKNALEASQNGEPVEVSIENREEKKWHIQVKSHPLIPAHVQLQLFHKSFSTKGRGRGWGTYSIRLLTESYLKGKVSFVSNEKQRTVFSLEIPDLNHS